jgi:hypothetical protein
MRSAVSSIPVRAAPATPVHVKKPAAGYWIAASVAIAGLLAGAIWGAFLFTGLRDHVSGFARATVPGSTLVTITQATGGVVYFEGSGPVTLVRLRVDVTGPAGAPVQVQSYGGDLRYDAPGGRVGHAVATFDASSPGVYMVTTSATGLGDGRLAVGDSYARRSALTAFAAGGVIFGSILLGGAIALFTSSPRRHRLGAGKADGSDCADYATSGPGVRAPS